jgi:hypothetical protein
VKLSWLFRDQWWRMEHLRICDTCRRKFDREAPGAIDAQLHRPGGLDVPEKYLDFRGFSGLQFCPRCAAPHWKQAVILADHQAGWR